MILDASVVRSGFTSEIPDDWRPFAENPCRP